MLAGRVEVKRAMANGSQSVHRGRTILTDVIVADLPETVISGLRCRSNDLFVLRVFTPAFIPARQRTTAAETSIES